MKSTIDLMKSRARTITNSSNAQLRRRLAVGLKLTSCLLFAAAAQADTISLTLNPQFPSAYSFYSYTATDGSAQDVPVAPYLTTLSDTDGLFNNTPVLTICNDLNNPTNVGEVYTGHFAYNTDTASMEATYLDNLLNLAGGTAAPLATKGAISLAIWQIMFPSSTQTDGSYFPIDPAAAVYENQAYQAVIDGAWTTYDSSFYPTFEPDDTSSQRFGVIFASTKGILAAPEPGSLSLFGFGLLAVAVLSRRRAKA
jgi:hypothetical protein